jgi:hypothetical protein
MRSVQEMNDHVTGPECTMLAPGEIGYALVDDTGLVTNSSLFEFRVIRTPDQTRVISARPHQEASSDRNLTEYAGVLLIGCLLGFLMHIFVNWMRTRKRHNHHQAPKGKENDSH